MKVIEPYTREEAKNMDINDLLKHYHDAVEQVAIQELLIDTSSVVAQENIHILEQELRDRLHAGVNAKKELDDFQLEHIRIG